jgi:hypothetical protein
MGVPGWREMDARDTAIGIGQKLEGGMLAKGDQQVGRERIELCLFQAKSSAGHQPARIDDREIGLSLRGETPEGRDGARPPAQRVCRADENQSDEFDGRAGRGPAERYASGWTNDLLAQIAVQERDGAALACGVEERTAERALAAVGRTEDQDAPDPAASDERNRPPPVGGNIHRTRGSFVVRLLARHRADGRGSGAVWPS